jgi:multidrug efflux system outer membrane protein
MKKNIVSYLKFIKMNTLKIIKRLGISLSILYITSCGIPKQLAVNDEIQLPNTYAGADSSTNYGRFNWGQYFKDTCLKNIINEALSKNQELNIILNEINIAQNEVQSKTGEYLPSIGLGAGAGFEKNGNKTIAGKLEEEMHLEDGKVIPKPISDYLLGAHVNWELDIWKKLRNAKNSAVLRYYASVEGKNFMVTHLINEIANAYYELIALDQQYEILQENLKIQTHALDIVKAQKDAAKVTELPVRKFNAEVLKNQSLQYELKQQIVITENKLNILIGRFPQHINRNTFQNVLDNKYESNIFVGNPLDLLDNRPDIKRASYELIAAKLDVKVAKANFYPSLAIQGGVGFQAFKTAYLFSSPESIFYKLAGDLVVPFINRNAIKANYNTANAKQLQAIFNYQQKMIQAYTEVVNQVSNIKNLNEEVALKKKQIDELNSSVVIVNDLYMATRADYMEVLMTQRDALDSKMELIEKELLQLKAHVNLYKELGGGWKTNN